MFDGPFDLLLHLVARQKVDIGMVSIVEVADQYLGYIDRMQDFDLDVASDFMLVASQLLEIKAASLLPQEVVSYGDELDDLAPDEAREILIARLIAYKQFKAAAAHLDSRMLSEGRMHPRAAGLEPQFLNLMPDYLEGLTLRGLAVICADLDMKKDTFLLEAEHIAAMPIPVELHVESMHREIAAKRHMSFSEMVGEDADAPLVVVSFLAILELYKRKIIALNQAETFGEIQIDYLEQTEAQAGDAQLREDGASDTAEEDSVSETPDAGAGDNELRKV